MRDWEKAQTTIRAWEDEGVQTDEKDREPTTIEQAGKDYLADAEARQLQERTVYKYRLLFRQLNAFAKLQGVRFLKELDTPALRKFRTTWKDSNLAALKKLERLRSFFRFARENGWLPNNPSEKLSNPKVTMRPTLSFSQVEMVRILAATTATIEKSPSDAKNNARRLRALVLLLRYTGLRIGDAVSCSVERLSDGKLRLYTQKTGTHVHCPLPEFVVRELDSIPKRSEHYWFWTGNCKLKTAVSDWQGRLQTLFDDAEVSDGHAHRFRDTFAVELLLAGVPLERVSILLGHTSIKITEKHYSPWIRERQEQVEADVRRTWAKDSVVLLETKGTLEVHGTTEPVN
jgi:integrase/recombinase XerD